MVGEIATNPEHEPKAYSIMPFVWNIGCIVGPALGGMLANPSKTYPDTFPADGLFGQHPWFLPNLVCAIIMFVSVVGAFFLLDETHPNFRKGVDHQMHHHVAENTPMIAAGSATADASADLRHDSYGTFNEVDILKEEHWRINADGTSRPSSYSEQPAKWLTKELVMLLIALCLYTYHSMCYDHLLPIFFQDKSTADVYTMATSPMHIPGGLGLSTESLHCSFKQSSSRLLLNA
jgi:hypothetical protein